MIFYRLLMKLWFKYINQGARFVLVGGFNTLFSYLLFLFFIWFFSSLHYQISLAIVWLLSSLLSFSTQKVFVFNTQKNWLKEYVKCLFVWFEGYLLNAFILWLLVSQLSVNLYVAQLICIFIVTINTYILFKYFAFNRRSV